MTFSPQPYPLYAVPLTVVQDPARFEVAADPVRLVLGWRTDDDGVTVPVFAGAPGGTGWSGPVVYETSEAEAKKTAQRFDRAERATVRDARVVELFERWETWMEKVSRRVEDRLDRYGPR